MTCGSAAFGALNYRPRYGAFGSINALFNKVLNPSLMRAFRVLGDLVDLLLPRRCSGCDRGLNPGEAALCLHCLEDLPHTRFHHDPLNPVEVLLAGRLQVHAATALLRFDGAGRVQRLLHRLKYRGDRRVGAELGRLLGTELAACERFSSVDTILAVPLHRSKEHLRGYNQSQLLVDGIRTAWPLADASGAVVRSRRTQSQTRKSREQRMRNVSQAFLVKDEAAITGRHVLLVDDVVTTGATLGSLAGILLARPGTRVSIAALAHA